MRRPLLFMSFCLVALIALGYCRGSVSLWDGPPDGTTLLVTGQVKDKDDHSFDLEILEILNAATLQQNLPNDSKQNKFIVSYDGAQKLILGSTVRLEGTFFTFSHATNPGQFDYADYYYSVGYLGRLSVSEVQEISGEVGIRELLYQLRLFWKNRLYEVFPPKEASVMAAILLGEKGDVDKEIRALYQRNGIVHILSISGVCTQFSVSLRPP